jgi:hypothetical protein
VQQSPTRDIDAHYIDRITEFINYVWEALVKPSPVKVNIAICTCNLSATFNDYTIK